MKAPAKGAAGPSAKVEPTLHLFWGDEFLVRRDADALVQELVPGASAGLNWVVMDGASPREVAQELATLALFPGKKVVQLRDPEFLAPKKGRADGLARVRDAWKAGRRKEATRRLLGIAGRAGWGVEALESPSSEAWQEELQIDLSDADLALLREIGQYARDERVTAPEGDAGPLLQRLEAGLPEGHTLVVSATDIDPKHPLVAFAKKSGRLIERKVAGRLKDFDLNEAAAEILEPLGKRLGKGAEAALKARVGTHMRLLQSELEKLALHAEGKTIELADVELLVAHTRDEEYLELSDAVQKRDLAATLRYVEEALSGGGAPLMVLGALSSIVRGLLESRERLTELSPKGPPRSFDDFRLRVFPKVAEEIEARGGRVPHPYGAFLQFQAASRFQRQELVAALQQCAQADLLLKSSSPGQLVIERLVWTLCGAARAPEPVPVLA